MVHDPQRATTPSWKPLLDEVLILCISSMQWSSLVFMVEETTKQLDWSKDTKGFRSVLLSLGNVLHSDNWWREFVRLLLHTEGGCQRVSHIQYVGCRRPQISSWSSVKLICNCRGTMSTSLKPNQQSPPSCPTLVLFKRNRARHEL